MPVNNERPYSPVDGVHVKDDFLRNDSVADALMGEVRWEIENIGAASTYSLLAADEAMYGVLRQVTNSTANRGSALRTFVDGLVFGGNGGGIAFRFRFPNISGNTIAGNNFRIGADDSITITDGTVGITVVSIGGVLTLRADSNDGGDLTQAVTDVSTLTSGTTAVLDTWHDVLVKWTGANGQGGPRFVECFVDGELGASVFCNIDDDEEVELKIAHWNTSGTDLELDLDYYEFWQWR